MKKIIFYLVFLLVLIGYLLTLEVRGVLPQWMANYSLLYVCGLTGGIGGCIYCLRAVYLNISVRKNWDKDWEVWYYIRPIVSTVLGGVSYIFLKAGLIVLEANIEQGSTNYGFIALAFIAGLNVDKFVAKLESIAETTLGIEKSRSNNIRKSGEE